MNINYQHINIGPYTVQNRYSFRGAVSVWENGRFLWKEVLNIERLSKIDALQDAINYKKELLELNGVKV